MYYLAGLRVTIVVRVRSWQYWWIRRPGSAGRGLDTSPDPAKLAFHRQKQLTQSGPLPPGLLAHGVTALHKKRLLIIVRSPTGNFGLALSVNLTGVRLHHGAQI